MGGVISYCLVEQVTTVRVLLTDGEVLEFDQPIIAKQLMKAYPGHLVVHCSEVSRKTGVVHRSKVSMLRAADALQLGQAYCLLRIPAQRGKGQQPKGSGSIATNRFGVTAQQDQNSGTHHLPQLAALHQQQFGASWRPHLDAIIESPLSANTPSRSHSLVMSPLARQAGYVPGSVRCSPGRIGSKRADAREAASPLRGTSSANSRDPAS